jgi:putative phosphoesterase
MSDTHGNGGLMFAAAEAMVERFGAEWVYHAGDDYRDAETLDFAGYKVRAVPGLWCPQYNDGRTPRQILDTIDGLRISMAHAEKDLRSIERAADIVITGHSHRPRVEKLGNTVYVNPGHLKAPVDRGHPATFATVALNPDSIQITIHALDTQPLHQSTFPRP